MLKKTLLLFLFATLIIYIVISNLGYFLDITTNKIKKSDVIICMGGGSGDRLRKSIQLYKLRKSEYNYILSIDANIKDRNRKNKVLIEKDFKNIEYLDFVKNTYEELLLIKRIVLKNKYKNIIIVSTPAHSRRIDLLIKMYLNFKKNNISYTLVSSDLKWWNKNNLLDNKKSIKAGISELSKITYNIIYYSLISKLNLSEESINNLDKFKKIFTSNLNKLFV
jgi:putative ribosome biogenesis GTPase RsgA